MSTASLIKVFGVVGMFLSLLAGRISGRLGLKRTLTLALITCVVSLVLMGTFHNVIMITIFSVTFVAGIAFSIPTVISKVGLVVNNNHGFFLSINTVILFLGTAIAPILMIYVARLSSYFVEFLIIALIGMVSVIISLLMPSDQQANS